MFDFIFQAISNVGITSRTPVSLHERIKITNQINAFLLVVAILFTLNFLLRDDPTRTYGYVAVLIGVLLFAVMASGYHIPVRILTATVPVCVTIVTHASRVPEGMPPVAGSYALSMALLVLPYIVFDPRERIRITTTASINVLMLLAFPTFSGWFTANEAMYETARQLSFQTPYFVVALGVMSGSLFLLLRANRKETVNSRKFLKSLSASKEEAERVQADLQASLLALEKAKEQDRNRSWITEGIGKFAELMRLHGEKSDFYDLLVSEVAKYMGVNQAALFLLQRPEQQAPYLQMEACFAYNRKKFIDKKIAVGEGLTGQAVRDRDKIFLTDIPHTYNFIQSGLGEAPPACVLIMPMITNDQVEGVLELASFEVIEPYKIEFIQRLSESIASVINGKNVGIRTQKLLEKSQIQTNELQQKEEEMRQNMEEMIASQEEQSRRENELLIRIAMLEERVEELQKDLDQNTLRKNT